MKAKLLTVLALVLAGFSGYAQTLSGKEMFAGNCKACHSIGGGDIVGPDLAGLTERREEDWIMRFINSSQDMVKEGDEVAVELFNKYNKIAMPSHKFNDEELTSLISYMEEAGQEATASKEKAEAATPETADDSVEVSMAASSSGTSGINFIITLVFTVVGVSVVLLSGIAIYLIRMLRS